MDPTAPLSTGIAGLDTVLRGGLPRGNLHLLQGPPGSGKTTVALQFLRTGVALGERVLYVTLSQTAGELGKIAASHGWDLTGVDIVELYADTDAPEAGQTIFQTADLRLDRTREAIERAIDEIGPERVVYDSLLEVRLLTLDNPRYQRELVGLRAYLSERDITGMILDTAPIGPQTHDVQSRGVVHGVVTLDKTLPAFGRARRRIEVSKMRGVDIHDGWHDMDIRTGQGVVVFPRLAPRERPAPVASFQEDLIRSGRESLDAMFGGGLEPGTTTMVVGQAGTGKSTMASLYAMAALERGEDVTIFLFEERVETFLQRCEGLGLALRGYVDAGRLALLDFNPDEVTAGEFSAIVQREAEKERLRVIVIDSFTGYMASLAHEEQALFDIQALLKYLARQRILVFLIVAHHGFLGRGDDVSRLDMSFLGDTVLLLRMSENGDRIRRDILAVKKRHGPHSLEIRELTIEAGRIEIAAGSDAPGDPRSGVPDGVP
ncbi:MAG: ATPase domain-containing protein [Paracoccaceae bacterium]